MLIKVSLCIYDTDTNKLLCEFVHDSTAHRILWDIIIDAKFNYMLTIITTNY